MNDWMTSVADIPDDADDDLAEITPELVLVDPELARIMRERQPDRGRGADVVPTLRLLPAVERDVPIVPRPVATPDDPPGTQDVPREDAVAAAVETSDTLAVGLPRPERSTAPDDVLGGSEESTALVPATQRIVDAEPARVVEPAAFEPVPPQEPEVVPPFPAPSIAAPTPDPPSLPPPQPIPAAMPHPIARPERSHGPTRVTRPKRRGRRALAFVAAVAAASVATLGILNLAGGSTSSTAPKARAPISGGPTNAGARKSDRTERATAPSAAKPKTAKGAGRAAKAKAPSTPKATVAPKGKTAARPKPAAPTTAKPKPSATTARRQRTTPVPTPQSKPKPAPQPAKPKPTPAATTEARRFAWAPVVGALSYHVELFRGADRVLAKETTQPILELGPSWRYEGKTIELTPGSYRWYVWPVTKTGRATEAVVQAKLDIP
jgi:hypothetical protein